MKMKKIRKKKTAAFCNKKNIKSEYFDLEITIVWTMYTRS